MALANIIVRLIVMYSCHILKWSLLQIVHNASYVRNINFLKNYNFSFVNLLKQSFMFSLQVLDW